jgi:hypothetical protein
MAANPFDAAHRKEQTQAQLEAALAAYREMLDTYVHNRVPRAAAEADASAERRITQAQSNSVKPQ